LLLDKRNRCDLKKMMERADQDWEAGGPRFGHAISRRVRHAGQKEGETAKAGAIASNLGLAETYATA